MTPWIIITVVSLLFSALFSGSEIAFVTSDRVRVELDTKGDGIISRILRRYYSDSELFISTILVGNNVVLVIYGMGAAYFIEPWLNSISDNSTFTLIAQTLISTFVILLVGEFFPKTIFSINPNSSLRVMAIPLYILYILLWPVSIFTSWLSKALMRVVGVKNTSKALNTISLGDLNDYIEESIDDLEEQKQPVENEVKIFRNALDFSKTHVRDCMTPRNEIVATSIDGTSREELSAMFTDTGRSKIIVYKDDIDNILGYIHVSELFNPENDWREHLKPVLYAPENLMANVMMRRLLQQKRSIAIVVDEFGGTAGMLTLEDLMEEICGNIEDEHDKTSFKGNQVSPGIYEISGRCEIAEINERFNLEIPENDAYQTLAGYILNVTGSIPAEGAKIELEDYQFDILKKSANRLELIRITALTPDKKTKDE